VTHRVARGLCILLDRHGDVVPNILAVLPEQIHERAEEVLGLKWADLEKLGYQVVDTEIWTL